MSIDWDGMNINLVDIVPGVDPQALEAARTGEDNYIDYTLLPTKVTKQSDFPKGLIIVGLLVVGVVLILRRA